MRINSTLVRRTLLGNNEKSGLIPSIIMYILLISIGFVFLYPVLYMLINSFMSPEDLINPAVSWLPSGLYFENYVKAFNTLDFGTSFFNSLYITVVSTLLQTAVCAVTGYGLARFKVPLKMMILALILFTFVIPVETTLIPRYVMFNAYKLLDTPFTLWLTALTGQGLKSAVFILVFYQMFRSYPVSIDEAAELDGAGKYKIFSHIALPMVKPGIVLTVLFSFVWYWNETRQSGLFFGTVIKTLPMKLGSFAASYSEVYSAAVNTTDPTVSINEAVTLAGTMLSCLPILIMFVVLQKQFVESIAKTGITGE
jgi:multiple sugar transport system permease protein